nr:immunoglobulin light chain junction region [Macaca mulatta]
CSSYAGSSVSF